MSSQEQLIRYQKINIYLRILIIIILLVIASSVIYFKYGTPPNLEDSKLTSSLFGNEKKVIDCRHALIYYAENVLGTINSNQSARLYEDFNLSEIIIISNNSG